VETIRQYLGQKRKRSSILVSACLLTFLASILIPIDHIFVVGMLGLVLGIVTGMAAQNSFRCPSCNGNLSHALSWPRSRFFSIPASLKYCVHCGIDLDTQMVSDQVVHQTGPGPSAPNDSVSRRPAGDR
jgi:hypothetical protein